MEKYAGNDSKEIPQVSIRKAVSEDVERLTALGIRTFRDAFVTMMSNRQDLEDYIRASFTTDEIRNQLQRRGSVFLIAERVDDPLGYAHMAPGEPPACINGRPAVEIIRFYVDKLFHGRGIGSRLMEACLEEAENRKYKTVWLCSWQLNDRANRFYERWGFERKGEQTFVIGKDVQDDFVFARDL